MTTTTTTRVSSSSSSQLVMSCEHNALIRRQFMKIEALESQLALLRLERDALAGDNERLQFQLECATAHRLTSQDVIEREENQREGNQQKLELSQQLIDRRVDALERKYGGQRAREAAIKVQRAFRAYRLQKRFQSIAFQALKNFDNRSKQQNNNSLVFDEQNENRNTRSDETHSSDRQLVQESLVSSVAQQHECERKRRYRVGLNLLNKRPEKGISFLMRNGFLETHQSIERQTQSIARFLLTRKGVSKAVVGDYLSKNDSFSQKTLLYFTRELDFSSLPVDSALRKFQTYFRFPGEAQKIERLVESFATRYVECNPELQVSRDSVFILAFAIIMLNTDLHSPTNSRNRMSSEQWLLNLSRVFNEEVFSKQFLLDIYQRIKSQELRTGADHVTQVSKVQSAIISSSRGQSVPNLCLESRRLVCYCRLYEVRDILKKETKDRHQREVFLFNDLLLITKLSPKAKNQMPEYLFRQTLPLEGLSVNLFETQFHRFGIDIRRKLDDKRLLCFNARNQLDQKRFADDLKESILETDEMEILRITKTNSMTALNETNNSREESSLSSSSLSQTTKQQSNETQCSSSQDNNRRKSSSGSLDSGLSLPSRDHSPQTSALTAINTSINENKQ